MVHVFGIRLDSFAYEGFHSFIRTKRFSLKTAKRFQLCCSQPLMSDGVSTRRHFMLLDQLLANLANENQVSIMNFSLKCNW